MLGPCGWGGKFYHFTPGISKACYTHAMQDQLRLVDVAIGVAFVLLLLVTLTNAWPTLLIALALVILLWAL